jgi:S1-C subfamily serine protease
MDRKDLLVAAATAVLAVGLIALPSPSKSSQDPPARPAKPEAPVAPELQDAERDLNIVTSFADEGGSWLGVETREVTADKVKELRLPAERGVLVGKVLGDSPAAKSGLKDGDVITEINGQRVEGTAQFRRMIREIPAGRSVQLTLWRDGRAQTVSPTLGKMQENRRLLSDEGPQVFKFHMPEMTKVWPTPDVPALEWEEGFLMNRPRLGIDAEDLNDQLGSYFGAPNGEGILVRSVNAGSAAEKAGMKAGDVITSLNGEAIHSLAELRSKLGSLSEGKTVKLGVLRNKSALTLDVEIPPAKSKPAKVEMRTKI